MEEILFFVNFAFNFGGIYDRILFFIIISCVLYCGVQTIGVPVLKSTRKFTNQIIDKVKNGRTKSKSDRGRIYLHMFPRKITEGTVNISPYTVKTETWFRLNNIHYEVVETFTLSKSTNQIPYVIYNGEEITDSNFIIEYFSHKLGLDVTEGLTDEQQAASIALIAMLDNLFVWTYALYRFVYQFDEHIDRYLSAEAPQPVKYLIGRRLKALIKSKADVNGVGRKSEAEIQKITFTILQALSQYLGDKQFMMGDRITKVDCAVFSHLSQIIYIDHPLLHKTHMKENCKNLFPYMETLRKTLWPELNSVFQDLNKY